MKIFQQQATKLVFIAALLFASFCFRPHTLTVKSAPDYWPTTGWQVKEPAEVNISSSKLAEMEEYIAENSLLLKSLHIIRYGFLIYEQYYLNNTASTLQEVFSVTKSFTSALIGIAIDEGYLNLSQTVLEFFPNRTIANLDEDKESITIEHLLTMTSGLSWFEPYDVFKFSQSPDPLQYILDKPEVTKPGTKFNYNSGAVHLLTAILQNVTGKTALEYAEEKLFQPLGFEDYNWTVDPQGIYFGGFGLELLPRDMAKFGFLYLHNGTWDGQQIVPKAWVQNSTTKKISINAETDYGYLWWLYPQLNYYVAAGFNGQEIFVCPKYNLLVVTTAWQLEGPIYTLYEDYILPSLYEWPAPPTSEAAFFGAMVVMITFPLIILRRSLFVRRDGKCY